MKRKLMRLFGSCLTIGLIAVNPGHGDLFINNDIYTDADIIFYCGNTGIPGSLTVGSSQLFTATGTYSDDSTADITYQVTWTSSDPSIATISPTGLATGVAAGSANITAALSGLTSLPITLPVVVPTPITTTHATTPTTKPAPTLSSIAVLPLSPVSLAVGSNLYFSAFGTYSDGSTADITSHVTWASSVTTIATISPQGLVTGVATGYANITAAMSGVTSAAVNLTVGSP